LQPNSSSSGGGMTSPSKKVSATEAAPLRTPR
jgi:hypothetical protein